MPPISEKKYSLIPLTSMKFDLLVRLVVLHLQWCNCHGESRTEMFLPMGCFCLRLHAFYYSILIAGVARPNTIAELKLCKHQELLVVKTVPIKKFRTWLCSNFYLYSGKCYYPTLMCIPACIQKNLQTRLFMFWSQNHLHSSYRHQSLAWKSPFDTKQVVS